MKKRDVISKNRSQFFYDNDKRKSIRILLVAELKFTMNAKQHYRTICLLFVLFSFCSHLHAVEELRYSGNIGNQNADFQLKWHEMGEVTGHCLIANGKAFELKGDNYQEGVLRMSAVRNGASIGTVHLKKSVEAGAIRWRGQLSSIGGESLSVNFERESHKKNEQQYSGKIGEQNATFHLDWKKTGEVIGRCELASGEVYELKGDNHQDGVLRLNADRDEAPIGSIHLTKTVEAGAIRWSGALSSIDGERHVIWFERDSKTKNAIADVSVTSNRPSVKNKSESKVININIEDILNRNKNNHDNLTAINNEGVTLVVQEDAEDVLSMDVTIDHKLIAIETYKNFMIYEASSGRLIKKLSRENTTGLGMDNTEIYFKYGRSDHLIIKYDEFSDGNNITKLKEIDVDTGKVLQLETVSEKNSTFIGFDKMSNSCILLLKSDKLNDLTFNGEIVYYNLSDRKVTSKGKIHSNFAASDFKTIVNEKGIGIIGFHNDLGENMPVSLFAYQENDGWLVLDGKDAYNKIIDYLGIPKNKISIIEDGESYFSAYLDMGGKRYDIDEILTRCSSVGMLALEKSPLSKIWEMRNGVSNCIHIAPGTIRRTAGLSATSAGENLLIWNTDEKYIISKVDPNARWVLYDNQTKAMTLPPTLINVKNYSWKNLPFENKVIWNAAIEGNGESVMVVSSDKKQNKNNERKIDENFETFKFKSEGLVYNLNSRSISYSANSLLIDPIENLDGTLAVNGDYLTNISVHDNYHYKGNHWMLDEAKKPIVLKDVVQQEDLFKSQNNNISNDDFYVSNSGYIYSLVSDYSKYEQNKIHTQLIKKK